MSMQAPTATDVANVISEVEGIAIPALEAAMVPGPALVLLKSTIDLAVRILKEEGSKVDPAFHEKLTNELQALIRARWGA